MPFVEIPVKREKWVKITKKSITISKDLRDKYLNKKAKVRIFYDEENKLLGLESSDDGYLLDSVGRLFCKRLKTGYGTFKADWNEKHEMIVINLKTLTT